HIILTLPSSKTDPFRKDVSLTIAAAPGRPSSALEAAGLNPSLFAGHSFHRGAANEAAAAGYSDYEIQLLGRWRSDSYKLYIE
ncbi:hypothetical protein B0H19DRAFT_914985, partial [Mycena capillaripes]